MCVWQPTPRTADVTVNKTAGYVRVRILMIRWLFFLVFLAFILFTLRPLCWICEYACNEWCSRRLLWGRIGLCTHGVTTQVMLGCHCGPGETQLKYCWGCHCGQMGHNSSLDNFSGLPKLEHEQGSQIQVELCKACVLPVKTCVLKHGPYA